jgi:hypothetical protein
MKKHKIVLGVLWLIDGILQLQHLMFTSNFANSVIAPAAQGQPLIVSGPIHFEVHLLLMHPAIYNSFFASIQLLIGMLILTKRTAKNGLILSIIWSLGVWYFGEGLGGLLGLNTIILMGAPGAVIIYAILAAAVMPRKNKEKSDDNSQRPAYWLPIVWAILWIGGALYQLFPGQNTVSGISSMLLNNSTSAPMWMSNLDIHASSFIISITHSSPSLAMHMTAAQMSQMQAQDNAGYWLIAVFAIVQLLIGFLIFFPGFLRKTAIWLGILLSLIFWVIGQSLGGYFTGLATDPSSAPLFILLAIAILGCTKLKIKPLFHKTLQNLEQVLT